MSTTTSRPQLDQAFSVAYPGWLAIAQAEDVPRSVSSAWVDRVSQRNARVFSDTRFEVGQWVELCIRLPEENRSVLGKAQVEWIEHSEGVKENSGFRWALGLSLQA